MNEPQKLCPKCQQIAPLQAALCVNCAHRFRTHFTPPAPQALALPPAPLMLSASELPSQSQYPPSARHMRLPAALAMIGVLLVGMLIISGLLALRKEIAANTGSTASSGASGFGTADRDAAIWGSTSAGDAKSIYNALSPGMTEQDMVAAIGKPDSDQETKRDSTLAANDPEPQIVAAALPAGRYDGGRIRTLSYRRGSRVVIVELMDTLDGEHMQTFDPDRPSSAVWVVLKYFMR